MPAFKFGKLGTVRVPTTFYAGKPFDGGFYVTTMRDKDGYEYHLIDLGAQGDSVLRGASSTGVPDSGGDGEMVWRSDNDDVLVADTHDTDGKYNTDTSLNLIQAMVDAGTKVWTDFPIFNYIRLLRAEGLVDCYIPAQASTTDFPIRDSCQDGWGTVPVDGSETAAQFGRLLMGQDTDRDRQNITCYSDVPQHLQKFFNAFAGEQQFDSGSYWSSTESGVNSFRLNFGAGILGSSSKTTSSLRIRAVRRHYTGRHFDLPVTPSELHIATRDLEAMFWHENIDFSQYAGAEGDTTYLMEFEDGDGKVVSGYAVEAGSGIEFEKEGEVDKEYVVSFPVGLSSFDTWQTSNRDITSAINLSGAAVASSEVIEGDIGSLYKAACSFTLNSGGWGSRYLVIRETITGNGINFIVYNENQSAEIEAYGSLRIGDGTCSFQFWTSQAMDFSSLNNSLKKLTNIPTTGLHLVNSLNGTTKGVFGDTADFNPNDVVKLRVFKVK